MEEQIYKQDETIKIVKGMTGKISFEFKLLGKPEDNLERVKSLKKELDKIIKE